MASALVAEGVHHVCLGVDLGMRGESGLERVVVVEHSKGGEHPTADLEQKRVAALHEGEQFFSVKNERRVTERPSSEHLTRGECPREEVGQHQNDQANDTFHVPKLQTVRHRRR